MPTQFVTAALPCNMILFEVGVFLMGHDCPPPSSSPLLPMLLLAWPANLKSHANFKNDETPEYRPAPNNCS